MKMPKASHTGRSSRRVDPNRYTSYHGDTVETDGKGHSNCRKMRRFRNDSSGLARYLRRRQRHHETAAAATAAAEEAERPIEE